MREESLERYSNYQAVPKAHPYYLHYLSLNRDIEKCVREYAKGRVLDIGCGNKPYEKMFNAFATEYIGCDVIQSDLNKVDILCLATQIPLSDASFDTVFSTQVIEHVEDHQGLIKEAYRLLKPGGYFILSGPMYWHLHEEPYDYFRFTKYGFKHILEKNGFSIAEIIPNGGKWALMGQMIIHTMHPRIVKIKLFRVFINSVFSYLDKKYFNDINTMNYVVVGKKS